MNPWKVFDTLIQGLGPSINPQQVSNAILMINKVKVYGLSGNSSYDQDMFIRWLKKKDG